MFCPNCGNANQTPDTYCRACGEFLASTAIGSRIAFGGRTPQQNLRTINVLSLVAAIISLHVGVWMYLTQFNFPIVLYLGAAVLLCNAIWHASNFVLGMRLRKRLSKAKEGTPESTDQISPPETRDLLPAADRSDAVPLTVTESTTKDLREKITRRSS